MGEVRRSLKCRREWFSNSGSVVVNLDPSGTGNLTRPLLSHGKDPKSFGNTKTRESLTTSRRLTYSVPIGSPTISVSGLVCGLCSLLEDLSVGGSLCVSSGRVLQLILTRSCRIDGSTRYPSTRAYLRTAKFSDVKPNQTICYVLHMF